MIFYFSGTGNSRWVAEQIAALTGDNAQDIVALRQPPSLQDVGQVGLVFPIYAWGPPEPMVSFVKALPKTEAFCFGVCTCGSEAGHAMRKLARLYPLQSCYSLVLPNNYIIGAEADSETVIQQKLNTARSEIEVLSREILQRKPVFRVKEGSAAGLKSSLVNFGFNRFARSTKPFHADSSCDGCGLCAHRCPAATISLREGRPVWGTACYQCLRCLNECPRQAIQYGDSTQGKTRYTLQKHWKES